MRETEGKSGGTSGSKVIVPSSDIEMEVVKTAKLGGDVCNANRSPSDTSGAFCVMKSGVSTGESSSSTMYIGFSSLSPGPSTELRYPGTPVFLIHRSRRGIIDADLA